MAVGAVDNVSPNEALDKIEPGAEEEPSSDEGSDELELAEGEESESAADEEQSEEIEASSEDEDEVEAKSEDEAEAEAPVAKGAQKRIRQLVEERNTVADELRASRAESQRALQAMQYQFQQQQQAMQERYEQIEREKYHVEAERREQEAYAKMSLAEQLKFDAVKRARGEMAPEMQAMEQRFQAELQRRDNAARQAQEQWKRQERIAKLDREATDAMSSVLFRDVDPADVATVKDDFMDIFLAYAGGKGEYPKDAAPKFRKVLERVALAYTKSKSKASKAQVEKSTKAGPSSGSMSRSPSSNGAKSKKPSWDELQAKGMDYIDYAADRIMRGM